MVSHSHDISALHSTRCFDIENLIVGVELFYCTDYLELFAVSGFSRRIRYYCAAFHYYCRVFYKTGIRKSFVRFELCYFKSQLFQCRHILVVLSDRILVYRPALFQICCNAVYQRFAWSSCYRFCEHFDPPCF